MVTKVIITVTIPVTLNSIIKIMNKFVMWIYIRHVAELYFVVVLKLRVK